MKFGMCHQSNHWLIDNNKLRANYSAYIRYIRYNNIYIDNLTTQRVAYGYEHKYIHIRLN
jgi:hypothetical protein